MSRTYKDKPAHLSWNWKQDREQVPYESDNPRYDGSRIWYFYIGLPTTKPKKRKEVDTEEHWMSTPSWWTHMCMIKPQRRAGRIWEATVLREDIEETDAPGVSKRPHIYYW